MSMIGIDLGTGFSVVSVWKDNRAVVLSNEFGSHTTPSIVTFKENGEKVIGVENEPGSVVFDVKRFIGRKFSDPTVQSELKYLPYKVIEGPNDNPLIEVQVGDTSKVFRPEQISALILEKMKGIAEAYLSETITSAVVTVPAYFNNSQRSATKDACLIAGIKNVRLISEPTASSVAYGLDQITGVKEQNILCFDWGAGTLDVSLVNIENGVFEVIATAGNSHLGGRDITNKMLDFVVSDIKAKFDVEVNIETKMRLKTECEAVKRALSEKDIKLFMVKNIFEGQDYYYDFTRSKLEELCEDLLTDAFEPVKQVLLDSGIKKSQIDNIVLIGGSSRIPKIQAMLKEYFDGKELNKSIDPDECVAYGASVMGAVLTNQKDAKLEEIVLLDVTPISLGVETTGGVMTTIIPRNSTIPVKKTMNFSTSVDNQQRVLVQIFEGERALTKDCNLLGKFYLENLPAMARGKPKIEVTFSVDLSGILCVSAVELSTNNQHVLVITEDERRLSEEEREMMIKEAETNKEEDNKIRRYFDIKGKLENYVSGIRDFVSDENNKSADVLKERLLGIADELEVWLNEHPEATLEEYTERYEKFRVEFNSFASQKPEEVLEVRETLEEKKLEVIEEEPENKEQ